MRCRSRRRCRGRRPPLPHAPHRVVIMGPVIPHIPYNRAVKYGVSLHAYADDTQLYLHFRRDEMVSSADQLERCVLDIGHWMSANRLKEWQTRQKCCSPTRDTSALNLGTVTAVASSHVRLLGVDISLDLSVNHHVSRVCAGCLYSSTLACSAVAGI